VFIGKFNDQTLHIVEHARACDPWLRTTQPAPKTELMVKMKFWLSTSPMLIPVCFCLSKSIHCVLNAWQNSTTFHENCCAYLQK